METDESLSHVFEMRVLEKFPGGHTFEIGRITEDDDAQLWPAWGPSISGKRSYIGGYQVLHRAFEAVQERWLTEPASGTLYVRAAGRLVRLDVVREEGYGDVLVDCTDTSTGMSSQAAVSDKLSVPALLAEGQVLDAISSAHMNATTVWKDGRIAARGNGLTGTERAAIRLVQIGSGG
jgi:hypothetical protein